MKTSLIIRILIFSLLVSACSNKLFLQRKYTKGHYFARKTSIEQSHKVTDKKAEIAKSYKEQTLERIEDKTLIQSEKVNVTQIKVADNKVTEGKEAGRHGLQVLTSNVAHVEKAKQNSIYKSKGLKRADINKAVMSWAYAQLAGSIMIIPLVILTAAGSMSITLGLFLISFLLILVGTALAIKSINLGNEAIRGDGGFFSKLLGFWGLLNGAVAFIFAFILFLLLIALI